MCKSKVQSFITLVSRGSKIMFLLLLAHSIPLLIATPGGKRRQYDNISQKNRSRALLVDRNIKDLATHKSADIPTNDSNKDFIASKVVRPRSW
jgi:hypothetical protein